MSIQGERQLRWWPGIASDVAEPARSVSHTLDRSRLKVEVPCGGQRGMAGV